MKGARLAFTKPALLDKLVQGLDEFPMDDRDTKVKFTNICCR